MSPKWIWDDMCLQCNMQVIPVGIHNAVLFAHIMITIFNLIIIFNKTNWLSRNPSAVFHASG